MGNSSSLYLEELKTKQHPILLVTGVKLKAKEVVKFLQKVESECPTIEEIHVTSCRMKVIPPNVSDLKNLRIFNCDNNKISKLPYSLDKHTALKELILTHNQFVEFPREILFIPSLTSLVLSHNQISYFPDLSNLGAVLQNVKEIRLDANSLSTFPPQLCALPSLTSLSLNDNRISILPEELIQLTSLTNLSLTNNHFTFYPPVLYSLPALLTLNLSNNQISVLPLNLENFHRNGLPVSKTVNTPITHLELKHNLINVFPEEICNMTCLTTLKLNDNRITSISEHISRLTRLRELYLSENEIVQLPLTIGYCTGLKKLYMEYNSLKFVPPEIVNLNNLVVLILHHNNLTHLPWELKQMVQLLSLSLDDNPFDDEELKVMIKTEGSLVVVFSSADRLVKGSRSANSSPTMSRRGTITNSPSSRGENSSPNSSAPNSPKVPSKFFRTRSRSHENITLLDATRYSGSFVKLSPLVEENPNPVADHPPKNFRHSGNFLSPILLSIPLMGGNSTASFPSPVPSPSPSPWSSPKSSPKGSPPITPPFGVPAISSLIPDPAQTTLWQSSVAQPMSTSPTPAKKKSSSFTLRLSKSKNDVGDEDRIPPYATFKAAFESLLDEQDFSIRRRESLGDLSKEEKWAMIAQYKWDTLDLLKKGNASQKSARNEQFFTLRRGSIAKPTLKTPKEFIGALSEIMLPPVSTVRDLQDMLSHGGKNAAEFMDIGGIPLILELLNKLFKETGYVDLTIALLQCMETLVEVGLSSVLTALDSVSVITQYLSYGSSTVIQIVQGIMIEILHIFHIGYKVVNEALLANQHSERFVSQFLPLIKILQTEKDLTIKEQTLVILGCLIEYSGGLEVNFAIECELHKLGIGDIFNDLKQEPLLKPAVESFENLFVQHIKDMTEIHGRRSVMFRLGQNLSFRDDVVRISLKANMDCITIPIHKGTTGLDVLTVILKRYTEYNSKNFEWGLSRTEHPLLGGEPVNVWIEPSKSLISQKIAGDDILDFKIRRLFVNITLKPDAVLPAAVEVDPGMLVSEATGMLLSKFQLDKKRHKAAIQEDYWNEYGMYLYDRGKHDSGYWLDETKKLSEYDFNKKLVGLQLKKNTLNVLVGKMRQTLSFDPELEIHQIRDAIYNFVGSKAVNDPNGAERFGLFMEYPDFMSKPAEWLVNNKKLKGYYIPKECVVKLRRKPIPAIVKVGLISQPVQKVTVDIGNKVEDEIFKLSSILTLPEAFDVLLLKDGNMELADATALTLEHTLKDQKVTEGSVLYIKVRTYEDMYIWHEPKGGDNELYQAKADGTQTMLSGTFNKIIEYLTSADIFDIQIRDVLLNTYISFTSVEALWEKLAQRFTTPPALDDTMSTLIKQRVMLFIKNWIKFEDESKRWLEFENKCEAFLSAKTSDEYKEIHQIYLKCLKEKTRLVTYQHTTPAPKSKLPKLISPNQKLIWWDIDETEAARQISLLIFGKYAQVEHYELLNQIWTKSPDRTPYLTDLISIFNKISKWVIGSILSEKNLKNRAKMYTKMIKIGKCLKELNNYFAVMAFISALNSAAISRLKYTRALVHSNSFETLAEMEKLMSMEGSFKEYRNSILDASPPCVPYIGVHLSDLVFIAEGNPKTVGHRINVERLVLESNVITLVKKHQRIPYNFTPIDVIQQFFNSLPLTEEKDSFELSLQCEPRSGLPRKPEKEKVKEKKEKKVKEEKEEDSPFMKIGPDFWNFRGSHAHLMGLVDIGTQMSLIRLESGRFLVIDTIHLSAVQKRQLDKLTENGNLIEAVLCTHPFHTLYAASFYQNYPKALYYGTPRHLRVVKSVKWEGDLKSSCNRGKWLPEIDMSIPDGAEFVAPLPEKTNHFSCVFVFHAKSGTIHINDTIMVGFKPGVLLKLGGFKHGDLSFHPSLKGPGLYQTENAPFLFRDWLKGVITNWDFDNICAAHMGNKLGGAKLALTELIDKSESLFQKLSKRHTGVFALGQAVSGGEPSEELLASGTECG